VGLQMASKLLWMIHRKGREGRKGNQVSPQISADERRLNREKASTTKDTRSTPLSQAQGRSGQATEHEGAGEMNPVQLAKNAGNTKRSGIAPAEVIVIRSAERVDIHAEKAKGPPGWARAA
jgi:hypothetical protein